MKGIFPIDKFAQLRTPFYYYDMELLRQTLDAINSEARRHEGFVVHYAVKANANPKVLRSIRQAGLGADCVSGGLFFIHAHSTSINKVYKIIQTRKMILDSRLYYEIKYNHITRGQVQVLKFANTVSLLYLRLKLIIRAFVKGLKIKYR